MTGYTVQKLWWASIYFDTVTINTKTDHNQMLTSKYYFKKYSGQCNENESYACLLLLSKVDKKLTFQIFVLMVNKY